MGGGRGPIVGDDAERERAAHAKDAKRDPARDRLIELVAQQVMEAAFSLSPTTVPTACLACACKMPCAAHPAPTAPSAQVADSDGVQLEEAVADGDDAKILEILARNGAPAKMAALSRDYGPGLVRNLKSALSSAHWATARVYLGAQLPLDVELREHDADQLPQDLAALTDAEALALFAPPGTTTAASSGTFADVDAVLKDKLLRGDRYYPAMRMLLEKAQRGLEAEQQASAPQRLLARMFGVAPVVDRYATDETGLDPVARARVALAKFRITQVATNTVALSPIYLPLADLNQAERVELAKQIGTRVGHVDIPDPAAFVGADSPDAEVIEAAIRREGAEAAAAGREVDQVVLANAFARAGKLLRDARAARAQIDVDEDRARAAAEARGEDYESPYGTADPSAPADPRRMADLAIQGLYRDFLGNPSEAFQHALHGNSQEEYLANLRALGADNPAIGAVLLGDVTPDQADLLIERLEQIEPGDRLDAMQRSGQLANLPAFAMTPAQHDLVRAYLWEARPDELNPTLLQPDPEYPGTPGGGATVPPGFEPFPAGDAAPTAESTIAVLSVTRGMATGPGAAAEVLSRLYRLDEKARAAVFADPRYQAAFDAMPLGNPQTAENDFKTALQKMQDGRLDAAFSEYGVGPDRKFEAVALEELRNRAEKFGRERLRRAYVRRQQLAASWFMDASASDDTEAMDALGEMLREVEIFDNADLRKAGLDVVLGQAQLTDTSRALVDPDSEADYMLARLRDAAGLGPDASLTAWAHESDTGIVAVEALSQFQLLYDQVRLGGVSRTELAKLATLYYPALRALDAYEADRAHNRGVAAQWAMIVGMVVATVVVSIASGGTLAGPALIELGTLAALGGGTAAAVTGALIRDESSFGDVARDFGTGAVEGALAVAAEPLAARAMARLAGELPAGRAAVAAGESAAGEGAAVAGGKAAASLARRMAKTAIEGAIGGAGGSLFQTATDEATWDRGIVEAFAKIIAATLEGAAIGATLGGAIPAAGAGLKAIVKRFGTDTAAGVARWLRAAGKEEIFAGLGSEAQQQVALAYQRIAANDLAGARRLLTAIEGLSAGDALAMLDVGRLRHALRFAREFGSESLDRLRVDSLPDKEFAKVATGDRDAMFVIEEGKPRIVVRRGAPAQAVHEELVHLQQWRTDAALRTRMESFAEEKRAGYAVLEPDRKAAVHLDHLEVEADAQRRIIDHLDELAETDADAARRVADADETLFKIEERIKAIRKAGGSASELRALGVDEFPVLSAKGAQTAKRVEGKLADEVRGLLGAEPDKGAPLTKKLRAKLKRRGYSISEPDREGAIRAVRQGKSASRLPQLRVDRLDDGSLMIKEVVGPQRLSFAARKSAAAGHWERIDFDLRDLQYKIDLGLLDADAAKLALDTIAKSGPRFRSALAKAVASGRLDKATAGLLAKWGGAIDQLASEFNDPLLIDELLAGVEGSLTATSEKEFRQTLRRTIVDKIMEVPADRRVSALRKMLAAQPENASVGHLFDEFTQRLTNADPSGSIKTLGTKPAQFHGPGIEGTKFKASRQPDDVIEVASHPTIPDGTYLGEYKAGEGAFDIDQLADLAELWDPALRGFKRAAKDATIAYKGEIFFFSEEEWAKNALKEIRDTTATRRLLEGDPPGVVLMYLDPQTGQFRRYFDNTVIQASGAKGSL